MLDGIAGLVEASGPLIYVLAPLFTVVVAILPFPAEVPAMLNGMVFGPVVGVVVTWSGGFVGAVISFEIARRYGRPIAERVLPRKALIAADRAVHATGWSGLLTARLIPAVAFTALNWGLGLSRVRRGTFFWTTAVGILPGAIVFTVFGSGLGALYRTHRAVALALGVVILLVLLATGIRWWRQRNGAEASADPPPA